MFEGLFQPMHLVLIFGTALLVFDPKKLPELGKGLGDGIQGVKAGDEPNRRKERRSGHLSRISQRLQTELLARTVPGRRCCLPQSTSTRARHGIRLVHCLTSVRGRTQPQPRPLLRLHLGRMQASFPGLR